MGTSASRQYAPAAAQQANNANAGAQQQPQQGQGAQPTLVNHSAVTEATTPAVAQPAAAAAATAAVARPAAAVQHVTSTAEVVPMLNGRTATGAGTSVAHTASRTTLTSTDDDGAEDAAAVGGGERRAAATDGPETAAAAAGSPSGPIESARSDFVAEYLRNEQLLMDRYRDRRYTEPVAFPGDRPPTFASGLHIDPVATVYRVPRVQTPAHSVVKRSVVTPWRRYDAQLKLYQMAAEVASLQLPGAPATEGANERRRPPTVPRTARQDPDAVLDQELDNMRLAEAERAHEHDTDGGGGGPEGAAQDA